MPPLFGWVAVAVLTAPTTVSVSYAGTTTLTFTATTDQPLDGGGLWVEIFEKIMPGGIQYLGLGVTQERHLSRARGLAHLRRPCSRGHADARPDRRTT
jgi:hypothetical protein